MAEVATVKLGFYLTYETGSFRPVCSKSRAVGTSLFSGAAAHLDGP